MSEKIRKDCFYNIGVNYKKTDVSTRGKFSLSKEKQISLLKLGKKRNIKGLLVLSTCNRTEVVGFSSNSSQLIDILCEFSKGSKEEFLNICNIYKDQVAVYHLFKIGTGLDSQILGDYEIIYQLKQSFKLSKALSTTNAYLERLVNSVLQTSKTVKNKTNFSFGTTSVSYAAIRYIIKNISNYNSKNILFFGLGKMGKNACKNLLEYTQNKSVCLINRTEEKTKDIVKKYNFIRKSDIKNLKEEIKKTDVLIVSTSADHPIIKKEHIIDNKELLILDLSVPENVSKEVGDINKITLVGVDDLSKITDETLFERQKQIPLVEAIIKTHINEFNDWLNNRKFNSAVITLKQFLEKIKKDEIDFQKKKTANFDQAQAEIISSRLIQKITTKFVKYIKEDRVSALRSLKVINKIFQP